jgi:hypothetical protein
MTRHGGCRREIRKTEQYSPDCLRRVMRGAWIFAGDASSSAERGNRIELRSVRRLIMHQQQAIDLPSGPSVALRWQAHCGGTFGPKSSAAANQRQRAGRSAPPAPLLDRGQAVAWRCYFRCPRCDRSCLILINPLWHWRAHGVSEETIAGTWWCQPCGKYRWPSSRWTGSSSSTGRRPPSHYYQRHQHAVDRCLDLLAEPAWLTTDRWVALQRLKAAHQLLATAAGCDAWPGITSGISAERLQEARRTIAACKWSTRQSSWARRGAPRPGPDAREHTNATPAIPCRD